MKIIQNAELAVALAMGAKTDGTLAKKIRGNDADFHFDRYAYYGVYGISFAALPTRTRRLDAILREAFPRAAETLLMEAIDFSVFIVAADEKKAIIGNRLEETIRSSFLVKALDVYVISGGDCLRSFSEVSDRIREIRGALLDLAANPDGFVPGVNFRSAHTERSTMVSPTEIEALIRLYERGNFEMLGTRIDEHVEEIRKSNAGWRSALPPTSIKRFFVEMITFAVHSAYDYGVDVDKIMNYEDPYQVIFSMDDTPIIKDWFMESCRKLHRASREAAAQDKDSLITAAERYIRDNLSREDFGVAEIAETFGISSAYLSSCYSALRGTTIIKYIGQQRLEMACRYLEQTGFTVSTVARKAGYASEHHFYSCFKKQFGMTPAQYRKKAVESKKNVVSSGNEGNYNKRAT